ncbi:MAG: glycosyltransferase family 4 protein [Armatimonadetes bacterium]|nr:glycosyltransferase family 4 protein [Armatimonadota bacterium]
MRIAIFSDSYGPIVNGVSVSIEALVEELRTRGHSVHIFTTAFSKHKDADPNIYRFPSVQLPFIPEYPLAVPPFYPMLRHFRKHSFDIVHTHTPYTIGFVGLRWAESHGIPIVSTYHTLYERYVHYVPYVPKVYTRYKIAKHTNYYYNRCSQVIAPSEPARNSLRRHSVKTPITVIATGNPERRKMPKEQARQEIGARPGEKVILYVGRVAKEKNIAILLEAAKEILERRDDVRLWIVGDGAYRKESQRLAREFGIGDRVKYTGAVPRSEVDKYYLGADLFMFASTTETQGLVIGEAMTYGLPAVAVRGGGASESIRNNENGLVVGNSALQLSETVLNVLGNPALLGRLSENARKSVASWTHSDACERVLEVYRLATGAIESPVPEGVEDARTRAD